MMGIETRTLACVVAVAGFAAGLGVSYVTRPDATTNSSRGGGPQEIAKEHLSSTPRDDGPDSSPGAIAAAQSESGGLLTGRIRNYFRIIMAAEKEDYPDLMRDAMRELGSEGMFTELVLSNLARQWARTDPAGAFREVYAGQSSTMAKEDFYFHVFLPVLETAIKTDLEGVRELALASQHFTRANEVLEMIAVEEARVSLDKALETISRVHNPELRERVEAGLFRRLVFNKSTDEALQLLERIPGLKTDDQLIDSVFFRLAKSDVNGALKKAEALPSESQRTLALAAIAKQWAGANRDEAAAYISQIPSPVQRSKMLAKFNKAIFYKDHEEGANASLEIPSRSVREESIQDISFEWSLRNMDAARNWMDDNLDSRPWNLAASKILTHNSEVGQFEKVTDLAERLPADSKEVDLFVRQWKTKDPDAVASWINAQPMDRRARLQISFEGGSVRPPVDGYERIRRDDGTIVEVGTTIDPVTGEKIVVYEKTLAE